MFQIAYTSVASDNLGSGEVFKIIEKSAHNNAPAGLTGFLIFSNKRFFQVVEGPPANIDALLRTLEKDPRHHSIKIVHRAPITARSFAAWRMKRIAPPEASDRLEMIAPELTAAPSAIRKAVGQFLELVPS